MGIFKNILSKSVYETGANYQLGHSISSSSISNIFGNGGKDINVLEEYSGYVWKCVNVRSEELAAQNFFVERKVGDKWQEDNNHEFNKVLEGQDGGLDESELIEAHQVSMDMYGESFWYFSKGESSRKPFAIYLLDPSAMTVMVADHRVTGYVYQKDNERLTFDLDEIQHFRIHNPANPFRGAGPMQKAGWFIRSNRYIVTYVNNFLEGNGIPAGVVVAKSDVNDADWTLFKQQWASNYSGIDNAGKTAFVRGQDLEFVKTGLSLGEVDFQKVMNSSREDILAMFSMPKSKLGIYEDFNKASSQTSDMMFSKTFTKGAVKRVEAKLSRKIVKWYGPVFRLGSDFEVPEDREQKLAETDKAVGRWMSVNEAREEYGLPKLGAEYDTIMIETKGETAPVPKVLGKVTIRTKNNKADFSYEMKETFRSQTEDTQVKYETQLIKALNPVIEEQKKRVLTQVNPKKYVDSHFDIAKETEEMMQVLVPVLLELAKEQGDAAMQFVLNNEASFELTAVMRKSIEDAVRKATTGFNELTQKLVADAVTEGINDGSSTTAIANEIGDIYKDMLGIDEPGYRLDRLARTEVIRGSNAITEQAYKQSGVVRKKEWFANPGHCQYCASLNGSIITLGSSFVPEGTSIEGAEGGTYKADYGDISYPGAHPNCRCTLIPVIEG